MTNEELLEIAYTRELTDERVATAAAYWLDASRHERIEADGVILARYARKAMQEIEQLKAENERLKEIDEREGLIAISVRKDRDQWLRKAAENGKFYMDALQEIEQLKADNAALLDILTRLDQFFDFGVYLEFGDGNEVDDPAFINKVFDDARECLKQIGGIPNDPA